MNADIVILGADVGAGRRQDIRVRLDASSGGTTVAEVADSLNPAGAQVIDADGCAVIPAFSDHHLHLAALARAGESIRCGPPVVTDRASLADALAHAPETASGWVRGVGYTESVAGELTRADLDAVESARPVRIQHRSGALWMLNSVAAERVGLESGTHPGIERDPAGRPTGRLWRADDWLRTRLPDDGFPSFAAVGERLRSDGIAEMTDATPDIDDTYIGAVVAAVDDSTISGRVNLLGVPLGVEVDHPRVGVGPYKIVIADSDLPSPDDLAARIDAAHRSDRCVAVHCVSRVALALLLAAWDMVGVRVGDRIEHAAVVAADTCAELARRGIVVVTQPGFLPERGDDFLDDSDRADHDDLYRCGSLIDAGVPVALSSDAPYGPLNPWTVIAGATQRRTASGRRVGTPDERIGVSQAIDRYCTPSDDPLRRPRRIAVGEPGELVMADRAWRDVLESPAEVRAAYRVLGGVVY